MLLIRRAESTLRGSDAGMAALALSEPRSPRESADDALIGRSSQGAAPAGGAQADADASFTSPRVDDERLTSDVDVTAAIAGDGRASHVKAESGEVKAAASRQVVDLARVTAGLREPPPAYAAYARWHPLAYAAMAGSIGGQTVMFAKSMGEIVKATAAGSNQFVFFFTYVILVCMVACTVGEQHFLASGLQLFDAMLVVPVFSSAFMIITVLGGAAYFDELSSFDTTSWILFPIGILLTVAGVVVLSSRKQDGGGTKDEDEDAAREEEDVGAAGTAAEEAADGATAFAASDTAAGPAEDGEAGVELTSVNLAEQGLRHRAASDGSSAASVGEADALAAAGAGAFEHGAGAGNAARPGHGGAGAGAGAAGEEATSILGSNRGESVASAAMQASPLLTGQSAAEAGAAGPADGAHRSPSEVVSLAGSAASSAGSGRRRPPAPPGRGQHASGAGRSAAHVSNDAPALPHGISASRTPPGRRLSLLRPGWEGVVAARGGGGLGGSSFLAFGRSSRTSEHETEQEDASTRRLRAATETPGHAISATGASPAGAAGPAHVLPGSAGHASARPRGRTSVLEATLGLFQAVTLSHTMVSAFNDEEAAMAAAESGSFPAGSVADGGRGVPRPLMQRAVSARAGVQEVRDPTLNPAAAVDESGAAPLAGTDSQLPRSQTASAMPTRQAAAAASAKAAQQRMASPPVRTAPTTEPAASPSADGELSPIPAAGGPAPSYADVLAATAQHDATPGAAVAAIAPQPQPDARAHARTGSGSDGSSGSDAGPSAGQKPADAASST